MNDCLFCESHLLDYPTSGEPFTLHQFQKRLPLIVFLPALRNIVEMLQLKDMFFDELNGSIACSIRVSEPDTNAVCSTIYL